MSLEKLLGTAHNASTGSGGPDSGTKAAKRAAIDSGINGGKYTGKARATTYGTAGVGK
jgi:hypothetical protein